MKRRISAESFQSRIWLAEHNSHCPHLPSSLSLLFVSQMPASPAEEREKNTSNHHMTWLCCWYWEHSNHFFFMNNEEKHSPRSNRHSRDESQEHRPKAWTWTPASEPVCLKISLSKISRCCVNTEPVTVGVPCVFAESCASACSGKRQLPVSERASEAWTTAGRQRALWAERKMSERDTHRIHFILLLHWAANLKTPERWRWPTCSFAYSSLKYSDCALFLKHLQGTILFMWHNLSEI